MTEKKATRKWLFVDFRGQSGEHVGYAGLVDLETGNIVWLNADEKMGGDVRTEDGMQKRVAQLLEDFPGLKSTPLAAE